MIMFTMSATRFNIELNGNIYYPGQLVGGNVLLVLDKAETVKEIKLKLKGAARCYSNGRNIVKKSTFKEKYLSTKVILAGEEGPFVLEAGNHSYPFSMKLPENIPATFRCSSCIIAYYGEAKLTTAKSHTFEKAKSNFTVKNLLKLAHYPALNTRCRREDYRELSRGCCTTYPITLTVAVPRIGYMYSEKIPLTVDVDNASKYTAHRVYTTLNLIARVTHPKFREVFEETRTVCTMELGRVNSHSSQTWEKFLDLAGEEHVVVLNSNLISVYYEIKTIVKFRRITLRTKFPIIFGDISFCDPANDTDGTGMLEGKNQSDAAAANEYALKSMNAELKTTSILKNKDYQQKPGNTVIYRGSNYPTFLYVPGIYSSPHDFVSPSLPKTPSAASLAQPEMASSASSASSDDELDKDQIADGGDVAAPWLFVQSHPMSPIDNAIPWDGGSSGGLNLGDLNINDRGGNNDSGWSGVESNHHDYGSSHHDYGSSYHNYDTGGGCDYSGGNDYSGGGDGSGGGCDSGGGDYCGGCD